MDLDRLIDEFGLSETEAVEYLLSMGYCLLKNGWWLKPEMYNIPEGKVMRAVDFLQQIDNKYGWFSTDICKEIDTKCDPKKSTLLRAHEKVMHGQGHKRRAQRSVDDRRRRSVVKTKKGEKGKRVKKGS
jgi:hypothetical protein